MELNQQQRYYTAQRHKLLLLDNVPPWSRVYLEDNNQSASQEIPCLLWNLKVHYWVQKSLSLVPVLSQMNPVHSNTLFPSMPRLFKWFFPWGSQSKFCSISHFIHACYILHLTHPPWFNCHKNICRSIQVTKLLIMQSSPTSCHFLCPRYKYSLQLPALKHP